MHRFAVLCATAVGMGFAAPVSATAFLTISSGTGTISIQDGSAGDGDPAVGAISYSGSVGSTATAAIAASGLGATGSAAFPDLRLRGSATALVPGIQITIALSDTDYAPFNLGYFAFTLSGQQQGRIDIVAGASSPNVPFDLQLPVGSFQTGSPGNFAYTSTTAGAYAAPYALTEFLVVRPEPTASFDVSVTRIDEPSATGLIVLSLTLLGYCSARRRVATAMPLVPATAPVHPVARAAT